MQHIVDDLVLIKSIGKGNYGEVYLTQKKGRPEYYATKKMERSVCEKPENLKRLQYEINILKVLNHPNIVKFYGLKKTTNHWYLLTEYCNGGSLLGNLQKYMTNYRRPFPEEVVQYLMKQIVSALNYLHFNKIIHRDLKLDNILVTFKNEYDKSSLNMMKAIIKIIDFGFATKLNGPLTFTALGTPTNMDPQILEHINTGIPNSGYNEKVDIWSLGTLCYQMVVGHMAFSGRSMEELFQKVKKGNYSLPMTLSKEIVSFINGMLQQDPNKRLTANQLLNHEFLTKHPSQFQPIDVRQISGTIGPGGVINMKSASTPQITNYGDNILQLWAIFNQPGMYSGAPSQMPVRQVQQVQPVMQLPTQQQYGGYMNQQQQYYVNSNQVQMMNGYY
jgi:serine/threonine protein kinase